MKPLVLTNQELQALMVAVNAGVQALGARIVVPLAPVLTKLEEAAKQEDPGGTIET